MKKYVILLMAAMISFSTVSAQDLTVKELKKDAAKMAKKKQKEGWEPVNNTMSLDVLYRKYNSEVASNPDKIALIGNAIGTVNAKIGVMNAKNAAINDYAQSIGSEVNGRVKQLAASEVTNDAAGNVSADEIDKFGAAFDAKIKAKVAGMARQVFVLRKQTGNSYQYEWYGVLDNEAFAKQAALVAKETAEAYRMQSLSDQVADFIGEAVNSAE